MRCPHCNTTSASLKVESVFLSGANYSRDVISFNCLSCGKMVWMESRPLQPSVEGDEANLQSKIQNVSGRIGEIAEDAINRLCAENKKSRELELELHTELIRKLEEIKQLISK